MSEEERYIRDRLAMQRDKPRLRRAGMGWYCMGRGRMIHAMSAKHAYNHWQFVDITRGDPRRAGHG